jgi:hypothetical protein
LTRYEDSRTITADRQQQAKSRIGADYSGGLRVYKKLKALGPVFGVAAGSAFIYGLIIRAQPRFDTRMPESEPTKRAQLGFQPPPAAIATTEAKNYLKVNSKVLVMRASAK